MNPKWDYTPGETKNTAINNNDNLFSIINSKKLTFAASADSMNIGYFPVFMESADAAKVSFLLFIMLKRFSLLLIAVFFVSPGV